MIEINQINENNTVVNLGDLSHQKTDKIIPQSLDNVDETIPKYLPIRSSNSLPNLFNIGASIANRDRYSVKEDTLLNGNIFKNDQLLTDKSEAVLGILPDSGSLTLKSNGDFSYTPKANFNGVDAFTYFIKDNTSISNPTIVLINVNPVNDAPIANNDNYSINEDSTLTISSSGILANDKDVDSNNLKTTIVTGVNHGTLTLNQNGTFNYTPTANFNGIDSFAYKVNDGSLNSNIATVTLTINPVNDAPIANNDTLNYDNNLISKDKLIINDLDIENDNLTINSVFDAVNGTVTLSNGNINFIPNSNFSGIASFNYTITDGNLISNQATVNLNIPNQNINNPDLTLSNLTTSNSLILGNYLSVNYSISNLSNINASSSNIYFYFSTDNQLDSNDTYITYQQVNSINGNSSINNISKSLGTNFIDFNTGNQYLIAKIDGDNKIIENNENNNVFATPIIINKTDLGISQFTSPNQANLSDSINVTYTATNNSSYITPDSYTLFYISSDNVLDTTTDVSIGYDAISSLNPGASINKTVSIKLDNPNLKNGNNYIFAYVDGSGWLSETNEQNNILSQVITINAADLSINNLNTNFSVTLGDNLNVNYTINNSSLIKSKVNNVKFYLSSNQTFELNNDIYLGKDVLPEIISNSSINKSINLQLTNNILSGDYYLIGIADADNQILESNENNNLISTSQFRINHKDLSINSLNLVNKAVLGESITIDYSIANLGDFVTNPSQTKFYLSTNNTLEINNDFYLGIDEVNPINPLTNSNESITLNLNNNFAPGNYYLLAVADANNQNYESNESNLFNKQITVQSPITNTPDLSIFDFTIPNDKININSSINIEYDLSKTGENIGTNNTKFYLSTNKTFDSADQILGTNTNEKTITLTINSNIQTGYYYILGVADADNQVLEANENNNVIAKAVNIINTNYSNTIGYGLINASASVARAITQSPFVDVPNLGGDNWNLDMINAPEVWSQGYTGKGVIVAVIDTGTRLDPELNIWTNTKEIPNNGIDDDNNGYIDDTNGWDMYNKDNTIKAGDHGTHVAGTIGAKNNGLKTTGVAPDAIIMPIQVFDDTGKYGDWNAIEKGIYYAVDNGAKVINMSLGGGAWEPVKTAIKYAEANGVVVVSAAGNDGSANPIYPAAYATEGGLAIGSVNKQGNQSGFSNRAGNNSNMLYVTAPGEGILSITGTKSGTSMATPHVAGAIALMLSANPDLTVNEIKTILKEV